MCIQRACPTLATGFDHTLDADIHPMTNEPSLHYTHGAIYADSPDRRVNLRARARAKIPIDLEKCNFASERFFFALQTYAAAAVLRFAFSIIFNGAARPFVMIGINFILDMSCPDVFLFLPREFACFFFFFGR